MKKMKNKKIRKNFQRTIFILRLKFSEKIFLRSQRSSWALQRGDGLFISLGSVFRLSWLKISNTGTARTCRTYIMWLIIYNMSI